MGSLDELDDVTDAAELRRLVRREREKRKAIEAIGLALGSTLHLDEILSLVVERISEAMGADRSTLYLLDPETGELVSKVAQDSGVSEIRLKVGQGLAGFVAESGETLNIPDAYADSRFSQDWDQKTGYRTHSILCVPMRNHHGRTIGVVQCLNRADGPFTADDEALLAALASEAAVSIENSKLFLSVLPKNIELEEAHDQLRQKVRELDVLFEIAQVSAMAMELEELLQGVLARTMRAVDAEAASILIADEHTGDLHFRAAVGGESEAVRKLKIKAGQGICGWVAAHGQPQIVNEVDHDLRHSRHISAEVGYHPRSVLCVPLRWDGGTGAVELLNKGKGLAPFTEDDLKLATVIAGHVSQAIQQAESRIRQHRQERLSTIGQFLSGVLHDLKTPMTVISGYVRLLVAEDDPVKREALAERVQRQVHLLNTMTRETLAFARGERKLWIRKVYLYRFFEEVAEQLGRELADRNVELSVDLHDRGIAYFDEQKMLRVLHNLARNAAEAIGHQGGHCRITVDRVEDGAIRLVFEDDGPGIPEAIRGRLFESFTTHGKSRGTGLGLAIVKSIVDDHGGYVSVESRPGRTAFTMTLPQRVADEDIEPASSAAAHAP